MIEQDINWLQEQVVASVLHIPNGHVINPEQGIACFKTDQIITFSNEDLSTLNPRERRPVAIVMPGNTGQPNINPTIHYTRRIVSPISMIEDTFNQRINDLSLERLQRLSQDLGRLTAAILKTR